MNQRQTKQAGFTLIEMMLAMAFIAVLLVTIALTVIQMGAIYNKGLTFKEVNQAARGVSDDLRRTFAASTAFVLNGTADTVNSVTVLNGSVAVGGRLCLGSYSYVWNIAKATEAPVSPGVTRFGTASGDIVRLVRAPDANKSYCMKDPVSGALTRPHILAADRAASVELLAVGDHALGVQQFTVTTNDAAYDPVTKARMYTVTYILGTGATSAMNATQTACLQPGDPAYAADGNPMYCNVQTFTVALTAGNGVN